MKIIKSKNRLLKLIYNENNLGFVPTMGAIHEGHLSLIKKSNTLCNKTIVTIFINKPQFNKKNDFKKYPRRIKKDISILKKAKINFLPLQPGDVHDTYADVANLKEKFNYKPSTSVVDGVSKFTQWYKNYFMYD